MTPSIALTEVHSDVLSQPFPMRVPVPIESRCVGVPLAQVNQSFLHLPHLPHLLLLPLCCGFSSVA